MTTTHITDLFYNSKNIDNTCDFILIHSDIGMDNILFKIGFFDGFDVYDYNTEYIKKILGNNNLDIDSFAFIYQIKTKNVNSIKFIIMANKRITKQIDNYLPVDALIEGGKLWLPKDNGGEYSYIGLVYSQKNDVPNYRYHRLVKDSFLYKNYNDKIQCIYNKNIGYVDISRDYVKHRLTERMFNYGDNYKNNAVSYYDIDKDHTNYCDIEDGTMKLVESKNPWYDNIANIDRLETMEPVLTENDAEKNGHTYDSLKIISVALIFVIMVFLITRTMLFY